MFDHLAGLIFVLLACVVLAIAIYIVLVRPFMLPLEKQIPTGRKYRAGCAPKKRAA